MASWWYLHPHKMLTPAHLEKIGNTLDLYLEKYDNILLMDDYNCEVVGQAMHVFCETYNLKNLILVALTLSLLINPEFLLILELLK